VAETRCPPLLVYNGNMPYRKEQFANDEIYHVILRGLDNNLIFKDTNDYYRGIFSIYEFNNAKPTTIQARRRARKSFKTRISKVDRGPSSINSEIGEEDGRDKFVDLMAFCFMPNHVHLLIKQLKDDGIVKFMRKVGTGFAGYFNRKYQRKGYVFQNRFRSIHIRDDKQLQTVFNYIHLNPASLIEPGWKEIGIKNQAKVINFLKDYKWSSYKDYIGESNFPSVTERRFLLEFLRGSNGCDSVLKDLIEYKKELVENQEFLLEA